MISYSEALAVRVPMLNAHGEVAHWALVHPDDAGIAAGWRWARCAGYASRIDGRRRRLQLHREVLGLRGFGGLEVDHINRDRLDNRRCNLRLVTRKQNAQNLPAYGASGVRGVQRDPRTGNWYARLRLDGTLHHLGTFDQFEAAAEAARGWLRQHAPHALDGESVPPPVVVGDLPVAADRRLEHPGPTPILAVGVARTIRQRRIAGERGKDLAREFGISQQLVCDIKMGRRYPEAGRT